MYTAQYKSLLLTISMKQKDFRNLIQLTKLIDNNEYFNVIITFLFSSFFFSLTNSMNGHFSNTNAQHYNHNNKNHGHKTTTPTPTSASTFNIVIINGYLILVLIANHRRIPLQRKPVDLETFL